MKRKLTLRLTVFSAGLFALLLCYSPTIMLANDAFAQDTKTPATKTVPATKTAPATAPAPAAEPKAEPKVEPKAETKVEPKAETKAAPTSEKEQSWWQALLVPVLGVIGMFIAAFLAAGLRKLVILIEKKWSIDIPDSVEKLMIEKARWALGWAEEQAEKRLLYGDGQKTEGAKKLTDVVDLLEKFAESLGYGDEWQRDKIEKLAEGVLHLNRNSEATSNVARDAKLTEKKNGNGNGDA